MSTKKNDSQEFSSIILYFLMKEKYVSFKSWGFKNWDTFFLAKPFGKISIKYGEPIYFEEKQNQKTCQRLLIKAMEN